MDSTRWRRIGVLFDQAVALPPDERHAFLDDACAGDPALRDQVLALLEADAAPHPALEDPPDETPPVVATGQRLGPYRILRPLGEGGMGTVYLAEREDVGAPVAIKLVRGGPHVPRFQHERRILARLHHPNIARFLDAGVTDDDTPYVVLEFVDGQPIDAYCDARRLPVAERLRLFAEAGRAVQYAHQNFVVHRDLKPSNILVTEDDDGRPQVKLLDFGIAKLISDDALDAPGLTRTGMRVLTPEYAAPEQVRGEPISAATDVYALGVLLYELLTGQRPYDVTGPSAFETEQAILTTEPERPSTAVSRATTETEAEAIAPDRARSTTLEQLRRTLRGDLDTIALKALRKEPERRYPSAEAFVDDIKRHLEGLPVTARPDTLRYRASKFVRRHRGSVIATVSAVLLLIGYAVTATVQAQRIEAQAAEIARERDKAEEVTAFLIDLFESNSPSEALGDTLTADDLLERGQRRIEILSNQPSTQATLMGVVGDVYRTLGNFDRADSLLHRSLAMHRAAENREEMVDVYSSLGLLRARQSEYLQADSLFRRALDLARERQGPLHLDVAAQLKHLATVQMRLGAFAQADSLGQRALHVLRETVGSDDPRYARTLTTLGLIYREQGRGDEAERVLREALAIQQSTIGELHPATVTTLNNLGLVLGVKGELEEAERWLRTSLRNRRALYGDTHPSLPVALQNLADVLHRRGEYDEAYPLYREAIAIGKQTVGRNSIDVASALNNLGLMLKRQEKLDEAESYYREAADIRKVLYGKYHPRVATSLLNLGRLHQARRAPEQARQVLDEGLEVCGQVFTEPKGVCALIHSSLGWAHSAMENWTPAETHYRQALNMVEQIAGTDHRRYGTIAHRLAEVLVKRGDYTEAEEYLRTALPLLETHMAQDTTRRADAEHDLGKVLVTRAAYAEAETHLRKSLSLLEEQSNSDRKQTEEVLKSLVALYEAWNRPDAAERYRDRLVRAVRPSA
jgi:serine/threonine-protein kinase